MNAEPSPQFLIMTFTLASQELISLTDMPNCETDKQISLLDSWRGLKAFFKKLSYIIKLVSLCVFVCAYTHACVLTTLSLSVFHNELIAVQPPSRNLLPCRHSAALNHPKVYKKMWVSWETWILPQLSLSLCFFIAFSSHNTSSFKNSSPPSFLLTFFTFCLSFPSLRLFIPRRIFSFFREIPVVMMKVLTNRGNACVVSVASISFILSGQKFCDSHITGCCLLAHRITCLGTYS